MPARVRLALMVTATLVLLGALAVVLFAREAEEPAPAGAFAGAVSPAIPPADFALRDQDGERVALSDYRGRVVGADLPLHDVRGHLPAHRQQIRGALDDLGHDVPALAVSVDPASDTPARARRFLAEQRMTGACASCSATAPTLARVGTPTGSGRRARSFEHSAHVVVIDAAGRQRIGFPVDQLTPEGLAHDIRLLEAEATAPRRTAARGRGS